VIPLAIDDHDDPDEAYNEAVRLLNEGGDLNNKKAAELLLKNIEGEHPASKRVIGFLYLDGRGVERDLNKAYDLISEAAANLDPLAMYVLGGMYEGGRGVEQSDKEALYMFAFAAEFGIPGAAEDADRIMARISERRGRKLRSRPILNLEISDDDVEAVCCKEMYDAVMGGTIGLIDTYKGPELVTNDEKGVEVICELCPFCGQKPKRVSKDKIY
jgi:TPR repeat protein